VDPLWFGTAIVATVAFVYTQVHCIIAIGWILELSEKSRITNSTFWSLLINEGFNFFFF
jgi:hypothetical protein